MSGFDQPSKTAAPSRGRLRLVAYLRVSTDEQAQSGLGLEAQGHACRQWAAREGFDLAGPFANDVSGAAPLDRRPGLLDAIGALLEGAHR